MTKPPAIQIDNLTKYYEKKRFLGVKKFLAVDNLSMTIEQGEIYGLLGLNGSGKTTTIKLILGLLFPTQGTISVSGHQVPGIEAQKQLGYLPEMPYFYPYLTAREILDFFGRLSGMDPDRMEQRIDDVLEIVGMKHRKNDRMGEFSKGMLQRIGVAQALIHDPKILLLDEPITGLDPIGLRDMRRIILGLGRQGKTVFFSSHIISEAEKICSKAAILHQGRLARVVEVHGKPGKLEEHFVKTITAMGIGEIK